MYFFSIASSSSGNAYILFDNPNNLILIDAGVSFKRINNTLKSLSLDYRDIKHILITHKHKDHISSLDTVLKHTNATVYTHKYNNFSEKSFNIIEKYFEFNKIFNIDNIQIKPIKAPHDVITSSFIFKIKNKKMGFFSDNGYIEKSIVNSMKYLDFIAIESNYSEHHIHLTKYPLYLKERILSNEGHLSNMQAHNIISRICNKKNKNIMLIHVSKRSNSPIIINNEYLNNIRQKFDFVNFHIAPYDVNSDIITI